MTFWRAVLASVFACALILRAAEPNIEFSGLLIADGKTRLALTDKATDTTQWVEPGSEFNGYVVARYEPQEEAVFVTKNGQEFRLGLIAPKSPLASRSPGVAAAVAANPANSPSTEAAVSAIRSNLRTLAAAARQYQAERGVATVAYADLVGPGKFISELKPVAGENYAALSFSSNMPALSVTMADGARVSVDLPPAPATSVAATPPPPLPLTTPTPGPTTAAPAPPAPPPPSAAPTAETLAPTGRESPAPSYRIQGGDTWDKISTATGLSVDQLKELNPAVKGNSLPVGQAIRIQ